MEVFTLEVDLEGAACLYRDLPVDLHGVQAGLVRYQNEADGGHHSLV